MSADRMPPDPFAEDDGAVDPRVSGALLLAALTEAADRPGLAPFASALMALPDTDLRAVAMAAVLAEEDRRPDEPHRRPLRRRLAAAVRAALREMRS